MIALLASTNHAQYAAAIEAIALRWGEEVRVVRQPGNVPPDASRVVILLERMDDYASRDHLALAIRHETWFVFPPDQFIRLSPPTLAERYRWLWLLARLYWFG